jgi:hypothetical protein
VISVQRAQPSNTGSRAAVLRRSEPTRFSVGEPTRFSVGERRQRWRLPGAIRAERAQRVEQSKSCPT